MQRSIQFITVYDVKLKEMKIINLSTAYTRDVRILQFGAQNWATCAELVVVREINKVA